MFPENPTNSSSLRILVGSMDSVCGIRGSGCVEGILGKVRGPHHGLPFTQVREQPPSPDSYQPLHGLPGPVPSFTSRSASARLSDPSPYCSLCLQHPPCLELSLGLSKANSNACLSSSPGNSFQTPEENLGPCHLWVTAAFRPVSFPTPGKHFNSSSLGWKQSGL